MLTFEHAKTIQSIVDNHPNKASLTPIRSNWPRLFVEALFVIGFSYFAFILGPLDKLHVPVWPHIGVLLGLSYMRGRRVFIWGFIGCLAAYTQALYPISASIILASVHILFLWTLYRLSLRWIGPIIPFSRVNVFFKWWLLITLLGSVYAPCLSNLTLKLLDPHTEVVYSAASFLTGPLSCLLFTVFCLIHDTIQSPTAKHRSPALSYGLSLISALCWLAFGFSSQPLWLFTSLGLGLSVLLLSSMVLERKYSSYQALIMGLILIALLDLPGYGVIKSQGLMLGCLSALFISCSVSQYISVYREQKRMQQFCHNHPALKATPSAALTKAT